MRRLVAVAVDKDRGSQIALKWAADNLVLMGHTVILVHVRQKQSATSPPSLASPWSDGGAELKELFHPLYVICIQKYIRWQEVVLDDTDVAKALVYFVRQNAIDMLVVGATNKGSIFSKLRKTSRSSKGKDIPGSILKNAPDFCTVFVIRKGRMSSIKVATRPRPPRQLGNQILLQTSINQNAEVESCQKTNGNYIVVMSGSTCYLGVPL